MILSLASGKGGTGKTTLSVALARAVSESVSYLDCDVEEPNGHLFLRPDITQTETVSVPIPIVDESICTACGQCVDFCQFNAIVVPGKSAIVFPEMCHGCGGCAKVCPADAITEGRYPVGEVEIGTSGKIRVVQGRLNVGASIAPPVIKAVKKKIIDDELTIIDCPPGSACPMIAAVTDSDYVILVTEPTPFGLHDLKIAVATMRELALPFGIAINRFDIGDDRVENYCQEEKLDVLIRIPNLLLIAETCSRGDDLLMAVPTIKDDLLGALRFITDQQRRCS